MKKKWPKALTILSIWMILLSTFLPSIAAANENSSLANGEYTIGFTVLKDGTEDKSVMDDYTEKPAKLFVENEKLFVELTLKNSDWIKTFQTKQNGAFVDATVVSEDTAADKRVVRFPVEDLSGKLDAYTHVVIPMLNYDSKYTVQFKFHPESLTEVNVEEPIEEPTEPEEPVNPEEPTEPEAPVLGDGTYTIGLNALHATEDKASSMQSYLGNPATLEVKAGKTYVLLPIVEKPGNFITDIRLQDNGEFHSGEVISEDEAALTRVVKYEVSNIASVINAEVDMYVPAANYRNTQKFRIAFDVESITAVEEEPTEPTEPETPVLELEDGLYTIELNALHATEDKASSMQGYLGNPATLEVKDGKTNVSLTIKEKAGQFITDLRLKNNGEFESGEVISEDEATLTRVVKYQVSDIVSVINAEVDMYVPAANYRNTQKFRIAFDIESITAVEEEPTEPTEPETPVLELEDGLYTIELNALHATEDKASSMQGYLGNPATLEVKDGKTNVSLTIKEKAGQFITDVRLENNGEFDSGEVISEDEAALTRVVKYELSDITSVIKAEVDMYVPAANYSNTQKFRIAFDIESITAVEEEEEPTEPEVPVDPEEPTEPGEDPEIAIGTYTIDFNVLKDGSADTSVMDGYTAKPALLTVEEAVKYVDLTLKNSDWIQLFQTKQNGAFIDAEVVSEDAETNTKVVRFPVENIEAKLDAYTHVVIPALNYNNYYTVQLSFDASSLKAVEEETEEPTSPELVDGMYNIEFNALHATEDKASTMQGYLGNPALLEVKEGKTSVSLTIKEKAGQFLTDVRLENDGELHSGEVISEDEATLTRVVKYEVSNIASIINAEVDMYVPAANYRNTQKFRIAFDVDSISELEEQPEQPTEPEVTPPTVVEKDGKKSLVIQDVKNFTYNEAKKTYELVYSGVSAFEINSDIIKQLHTDAKLSLSIGENVTAIFPVTLFKDKVKSGETITFTFDEEKAMAGAISKLYDFTVKIGEQEITEFAQPVTLVFAVDTQLVKNWKNVKVIYVNESGEKAEVIKPGNINQDKGTVTADVSHFSVYGVFEIEAEEETPENGLADGTYTIDFSVLKNKTNELSVMDDYTEKPATLVVENGKHYIDLTLKNSDWIKQFQVEQNGTLMNAEVVSVDESANKRVVRFEMADLATKLNAYTHVVIPAINYDNYYDVQFQFDLDSIKDQDGNEIPNPNPNPNPNPGTEQPDNGSDKDNDSDKNENEKPTDKEDDLNYDRDSDKNENDKSSTPKKNEVKNANTADTAMIGLLLALLMGSSLWLIRKYRFGTL
ncbi:NEAT domain-containing protein [Sutcliffiella halmapala]|uniref:NEAT domain-containing protein n=1 Tax=Sutcliffiella halmapala TaxID=79882 RepID=UPI001115C39D|nr:NEAT domain-containing protein [Sutcliffiella halmapala]